MWWSFSLLKGHSIIGSQHELFQWKHRIGSQSPFSGSKVSCIYRLQTRSLSSLCCSLPLLCINLVEGALSYFVYWIWDKKTFSCQLAIGTDIQPAPSSTPGVSSKHPMLLQSLIQVGFFDGLSLFTIWSNFEFSVLFYILRMYLKKWNADPYFVVLYVSPIRNTSLPCYVTTVFLWQV